MKHFRSKYCEGEKCGAGQISFRVKALAPGEVIPRCGSPAYHKVEEAIFDDEPILLAGQVLPCARHPLTQYVCCTHFKMIMGPAAACGSEEK